MNRVNVQIFSNLRRFCTSKNPSVVLENKSAYSHRQLVPKDPVKTRIVPHQLPPKTIIDADTIALLERLSLVDCANKKGIETLEAAIEFADRIQQVDTKGVEPMFTVLEDIPLHLREDQATEGNCKKEVLQNAALTEDDYFIAAPGNIPLATREDLLFEKDGQISKQKKEYFSKKESKSS